MTPTLEQLKECQDFTIEILDVIDHVNDFQCHGDLQGRIEAIYIKYVQEPLRLDLY